jgi:hypothetical protein
MRDEAVESAFPAASRVRTGSAVSPRLIQQGATASKLAQATIPNALRKVASSFIELRVEIPGTEGGRVRSIDRDIVSSFRIPKNSDVNRVGFEWGQAALETDGAKGRSMMTESDSVTRARSWNHDRGVVTKGMGF